MAALMISSQLLLTAFVIYWLIGQYQDEKSQLQEQLMHEYILVHDQLVDSMLMKRLVLPSLDDSMRIEILKTGVINSEEFMGSDSAIVRIKHLPEGAAMEGALVDKGVFSIHVDGKVLSDSGERSIDVSTTFSEEERMVRSVKLFINENPTAFHSASGMHVFAMNLDSASLMLNMEGALEEKDWPFTLDWPHVDLSKTEAPMIPGMLLQGWGEIQLPNLSVQHFSAYLIRATFPQMLFGLILLLLSGSALLVAYKSVQRQLALNRLRDDFIGNISHELKTPVSTVKIALEALRTFDMQKDPKVSGEYLNMASSELERLELLVAKVLHHEMLNNPSLVLEKEECDLGALARSVVQTLEVAIREKGASVTITGEGEACKVEVDRVYVEGMIMNLIDNGLKYTGEHPEILIELVCHPSGTRLLVSDKGPGIPEAYKDQVFQKFFRIPAENKHNVKGYGLGLNFASQVMIQHGGSISFSNLPEGGCRFILQFPPTLA